ncbi:MAG: tetratricopeptide repeat protein [Bacteroidales bacterium]
MLPVEAVTAQKTNDSFFQDSIHITVEHRKYNRTEHINNQRITDEFIEAFSKSIPRILAYTTFSIHWQHEAAFTNNKILTDLKGIHIRGYKTYRDFPVQKFLIPGQIKCNYAFEYTNQTLNYIDTVNLKQKSSSNLSIPDSINPTKLTFLSFDFQLIYNTSEKENFLKITQAIDQYYRDFPRLKNALEKVGKITIGNLNMLPIYSANLKEAENTLENITEKGYLSLLDLEKNDPLGFLPRFKNLQRGIAFKRQKIDNQMKNRDRLYYQEGLNYLTKDTSIARGYFEKSIQTNPFFSPAYLELSKLNLSKGQLHNSAQHIEYILQELKPDTQTYRKVINFNDKLIGAFIDSANILMDKEDFNQAVSVMERAEDFCHNTPQYECPADVQKQLSNARYGIYNAYISVARKAIERRRPELALEYIKLINDYQKENSQSIISTNSIKDLYSKVAELFVEQAQQMIDSKKYKQALSHLKEAEKICKSANCKAAIQSNLAHAHQGIYDQHLKNADKAFQQNNFSEAEQIIQQADAYLKDHKKHLSPSLFRDSLKQEIDYEVYQKNLEKGYKYLTIDQPENALNKFIKAKNLLENYNYEKNDTIDSLIRISAKPIILSKIGKGKLKVWGEKFNEAKNILNETRSDTEKFLLSQNKEIQDSLSSFKSKLKSRLCQKVRDTINDYRQRASLNMSKSNYLLAKDNYKKILLKASQYEQCSIDAKSTEEKLSENHHLFKYAQMQQKLDSLYKKKEYKALVTKIQHMVSFYENKNLSERGIPKITPLTFVQKYKTTGLIRYITQWYIKQEKGYKALETLKTIDTEKINPEEFKSLQKAIGKSIAKEDIDQDISSDYKAHSKDIAPGSWYKFFRRSYRSTYRKKAGIFPYFF